MTAIGSYERIKLLGEGTYGVVYQCRHRPTGHIYAVKKLRLDDQDEGLPTTALREVAVLREISIIADSLPEESGARNIVQLVDVIYERSRLSLVFEFVHTDLKRFQDLAAEHVHPLRRQSGEVATEEGLAAVGFNSADRALCADMVYTLSRQLMRGLSFLHSRRVIHRDLKPHNLLISCSGDLKIADFGLARAFSVPLRTYTHEVVTLWYRAPEVLLGARHYTTSLDVWSCACIIAEMGTGAPLFCGDSEIDQIFRIMRTRGTPTDEEWPGLSELPDYQPIFPVWRGEDLASLLSQLEPQAIDLIERMLVYEPTRRITAKAALRHPYLAASRLTAPSTPSTADSSMHSSTSSLEASTACTSAPTSPCAELAASPM